MKLVQRNIRNFENPLVKLNRDLNARMNSFHKLNVLFQCSRSGLKFIMISKICF